MTVLPHSSQRAITQGVGGYNGCIGTKLYQYKLFQYIT